MKALAAHLASLQHLEDAQPEHQTTPTTRPAVPPAIAADTNHRASITITQARDGLYVVTADVRRTSGSVVAIAYDRGAVDLDTALNIARDWLA